MERQLKQHRTKIQKKQVEEYKKLYKNDSKHEDDNNDSNYKFLAETHIEHEDQYGRFLRGDPPLQEECVQEVQELFFGFRKSKCCVSVYLCL